jgi:SPP1 gp7 family putative phage head morphogenesis protein
MSANDQIEDSIIRHQIMMLRYAKGLQLSSEAAITAILQGAVELIPVRRELTSLALRSLIDDILGYYSQEFGVYTQNTITEMEDFAQYELDFNYKTLNQFSNIDAEIPEDYNVKIALGTNVMQLEPTKTYTIRQALQQFGGTKSVQVVQAIRQGVIAQQTTSAIVSAVMALGGIQRRQAATLSRTIINHVATQTRKAFIKQNQEYIREYKWIATLDDRTSLICASRDQQVYKDIETSPKPPAHFNCRSTITFVLAEEYDLGLDVKTKRPSVGPNGKVKQVDSNTSYSDWLIRQPLSFQEEVLGVTRAKLFRNGTISLDRFVDRNGQVYTLDELRQQEPLIFESLDDSGGAA